MATARPGTEELVRRLHGGDPQANAALFARYRDRLRRMVELRLDRRLRARLDPSDVLQEAYLDATRRVPEFVARREVSYYVWLRGLAWERMLALERRHLGARCRDVQRECDLPLESSVALADRLMATGTGPPQRLMREELLRRVRAAIDALKPEDREVILMRHFEGLSNGEVAQALGLQDSAASMRHGRAVFRLKEILVQDLAAEDPGD